MNLYTVLVWGLVKHDVGTRMVFVWPEVYKSRKDARVVRLGMEDRGDWKVAPFKIEYKA
jgi:hypothetical protein